MAIVAGIGRFAAALLGLGACATGSAAVVEEVYRVPVSITDAFDQPVSHDVIVTVLRDTERARAPILILNHGRAGDPVGRERTGRARFPAAARFFVQQGYFVVMPTRIGYGDSGGPDVETRGRRCAEAEYGHGFATAADEVAQVLDWVAGRPDVDATRIVAVGQSYGGATTLALAARNPPGLIAAINFSGGSGGDAERSPERPCNPDRVGAAYENYGSTTRVPELWLYAQNDRLWGGAIPKAWFARYRKAGAPAEFIEMPAVGSNGHALFVRGADLWHPEVLRFLAAHAGSDPAGQPAER